MTPLESVRAKVIEAVPEIVERNGLPEAWCKNHGGIMRNYSMPCTCIGPITLADVLRAIGSVVSGVECVLIDGHFSYLENAGQDQGDYHEVYQSKVGPRGGTLKGSKPIRWNLALPLDEQEPEVIAFLAKILV